MTPVDLTSKVKWPGGTQSQTSKAFPSTVNPPGHFSHLTPGLSHPTLPFVQKFPQFYSGPFNIMGLNLAGPLTCRVFSINIQSDLGIPQFQIRGFWYLRGYCDQCPVDTEYWESPKSCVSFSIGRADTANQSPILFKGEVYFQNSFNTQPFLVPCSAVTPIVSHLHNPNSLLTKCSPFFREKATVCHWHLAQVLLCPDLWQLPPSSLCSRPGGRFALLWPHQVPLHKLFLGLGNPHSPLRHSQGSLSKPPTPFKPPRKR